tara:strand:+ start:252 stop:476 length:225 start_codon:yes stop_codon:yes gene_type:complete
MLKCISQHEHEVIGVSCRNNFSMKIFVFSLELIGGVDFCKNIFQPELPLNKFIALTDKINFFSCLFYFTVYEEK